MPAPNVALQYIGIDKPTLPYRSNTSPADDSPHMVPGSINVKATVNGWLEKRPGFSVPVETAPSVIPGTVVRIFNWRRWVGSTTNSGAFYTMVCAVTDTTSTVWAAKTGSGSFSLIYTDSASNQPFDFVTSNNFVFFGNATTRQNMRKWDGTDCTLWGLDAPTAPPTFALVSGDLPAGLSFDPNTGVLSGTPQTSGTSSISVTVTDANASTATQTLNIFIDPAGLGWTTQAGALPPATMGTAYSQTLAVQSGTSPYAFALNSGALPAGLSLSSSGTISGAPTGTGSSSFAVKVTDAAGAVVTRAFSIFVNSAALSVSPTSFPNGNVGTAYSQALTASGGTSPYTFTIVGGGIPAGLSLSSAGVLSGTPIAAVSSTLTVRVSDASANISNFLLPITVSPTSLSIITTSIPNAQAGVPYSQTVKVDGGASPYAFTFTAGSLVAQTGYVMGYTYTSKYGHESAMSPLSDNTGLFTDQDIQSFFLASTDPQVSGINLYRSSDGGDQDPAAMRLVSSLPNATSSYTDSTPDVFLGLQTGPGLYLNNPPQPLRGFIWSNGRIWGFNQQTSWFTGNEEITNGVPAECMSNAKNGNFYSWPSEVFGLASTANGVDIALAEEFWQISGDTLDTFRKSSLLKGGGLLSPTCVAVVGSTVFWIDTSKQIWSSDSGEVGEAIRPDLANIDPTQTFITYHKARNRNWLSVLDVVNSRLLTYDLDLNQWQSPWSVAATSLASGQTDASSIDLLAAFGGSVNLLEHTPSGYTDNGTEYADDIRSSLFTISPGRGTSARNRSETRFPKQFEMEFPTAPVTDADGKITGYDATVPDAMSALFDDDPVKTDIAAWTNLGESSDLQFGSQIEFQQNMKARRWETPAGISCSRCAFAAHWNAATDGWKVYTLDIGVSSA